MNGALQSGGHSEKTLNVSTNSQQLKSASENVQSSGTSPSQVKGKKRLRNDQIVEPIKGDQTMELVKKDLSTETIKREQFSKVGDGGFVTFKFDNINTEINKITDKGVLVSTEGVENLVSLMQLDITEKKIDLAGRIMLADVIAATEKSDFLNKFVQLRGVPVLDEWLQEVHKGKTDNGSNPHESEKFVEEFLLTLLRALEKLPINLNSLQICNIGKSVNNLRSHKNMEIQKRARGLVDTWKKRVDAEMSKISDGKFVGSGQPASFPMKPGHLDVTQAGNKRTGSTDVTAKISITRPSVCKALPSKHGTTDSNKKPLVPAPLVASSKDLHCKTAAGSGVSILSFPAVKEEKSNASSPSQSNSHSCSGDQVKTMTSSWKEEAMSSVVGSGNASKLTGSMNRSRRSSNGLLVTNVSGNHKETHPGRCMSINKVMAAEKTSEGEKPLDIPVGDHGSISRLIVRLPNTGRSPGKSDNGGSLEDQLVTSGKSSSVGISDKNDLNDGRLKLKNDVPLSHTTDVNTMSCQGNDVKEGLSGIEEHRRNAEVTAKLTDPARTACLSGNENGAGLTEPRASSYNSMLASVESCATYSEAASPLAVGDDMGMNLLVTVATGKISRSNIIPPIDSLGTPRAVEEPCTGNDEPMLGLSYDDDMAERNTPHDESANASSEKEEKKVDCVLATGLLQTDNNLTSKSAKSTKLQTTQSTITCMRSLDNLDSENIVVKPGEERIDEPEPEEGDSIGADPIKDKQTTDVHISGICTDNKPNFTGPLKDENTSFERNCKIEDNNNMCISDVKASNKCDLDVTDSGRKLEAPVVEEHMTSQVVKKPPSSSNSTENLLKSSSPDSEISLPAVSMPSPTAINESNVMKSNSMEISPLELSCEAKEKNIPPPSTDELVVVSAAVSRVTAEILENLKEANESGSAESSAIQEMLSTKIKETENSAKAFWSSGSQEVREEDHASSADRCSSIVFVEQVVTRLEVDLNEGIPVGEGNQGQPVISSTKSPSVHMPCQSHFSNSKSTNLPASVTVAAPAKGPFVPPEVLLKTKGEPGWKGTAATSAFRPAEQRKASNILDTLPSDGTGKKSRLPLNIDLNIADEDVEDMASQSSIQMTGITTAKDFPTKTAVGVDLDLNRVDDSVENSQFSASTNCRLELPLLHIQSASGGLPAGKANVLRNFDLNNRPGIDEVGTEIQPRSQQANYASIVPSLAPVTGHRTNNLEPGYASSSFCANSYPVAVPSFLPDRGEQSNPAIATVGSQRISVSVSAGNLGNDIYRGLALSSSPAMVISPATTFPYANLSFPSSFSLAPASFSGGSTPYVDSSSGGGLCFPAYPSLLVSPAAAVSSHYPRPYTISFPEGGSSSLSRQGLDLNTGPGSGYLEGKGEYLPSSSRYLLPASSQVFMEDQTRMHGVPGVGSKRKEPEGSWDAERPTERSAKKSSWK